MRRTTRSKPGSEVRTFRLARRALLASTALQACFALSFLPQAAAQPAPNARPQGGAVVAGQASIAQQPNATVVTQQSQRAAIEWRTYDVGANQAVIYQQPGAAAVALNRVTGANVSEIAGRIQANGQVVLVNPNGVLVHRGAVVEAQSFIASTADTTNAAFMAGRLQFDRPGRPGARIENRGEITVREAGLAALVAPNVVNSGRINARLGTVVLAGAETHTIDLHGDGLVSFDITGQVRTAPSGPDGRPVRSLVTNTGTVVAEGGTVLLTARAADGIVQDLVTAGGTIRADSAGARGGTVEIAGVGGGIRIHGTVAAEGARTNERGGTVVANATGRVALSETARVSTSGQAGGGTVAIGTTAARARAQGGGVPAASASRVDVAAGAVIEANATMRGDGGRIALLSLDSTVMAGSIAARGGPQGGNGGQVEVSGATGFSLTGTVDTSAPRGLTGTLLIDPRDLYIADAADIPNNANELSPNVNTPPPQVGAGAGGTNTDAYISTDTLSGLLVKNAVRLEATRDIELLSTYSFTGNTNPLTLAAGNSITISAPLTLSGNITLNASAASIAGRTQAGAVTVNKAVTSDAGSITLLSQGTSGSIAFGNKGALTASAGTIAMVANSVTVPGGNNKISAGTVEIAPFGSKSIEIGAGAGGDISIASLGWLGTAGLLRIGAASAGATPGVPTATTVTVKGALDLGTTSLDLRAATGVTVKADIKTDGGAVSLAAPTVTITNGNAIGSATGAPGRISIQGDTRDLGDQPLTTTATGVVELAPYSTTGPAADFVLTAFPNVSTGTLRLGAITQPGGSVATVATSVDLAVPPPPPPGSPPVAPTGFATLDIRTSGAITQTQPVNLTGITLTGSAASVSLTTLGNVIPTLGAIAATTGDLVLQTGGNLSVAGAVSAQGTLDLSSFGALGVGPGGSAAGADIVLKTLGGGAGIVLDGGVTATGTLTLDAQAGIAGAGLVKAGVLSASARGAGLDLGGTQAAQIAGIVGLSATLDIGLKVEGAVQITGGVQAGTSASGNVTITSTAGDIGLGAGASITAGKAGTGSGAVTLNSAGNVNLQGTVTAVGSGAGEGNVAIIASGQVTQSDGSVAAGSAGLLTLKGAQGITQTGGYFSAPMVDATVTASGRSISLAGQNRFGALGTLTAPGSITVVNTQALASYGTVKAGQEPAGPAPTAPPVDVTITSVGSGALGTGSITAGQAGGSGTPAVAGNITLIANPTPAAIPGDPDVPATITLNATSGLTTTVVGGQGGQLGFQAPGGTINVTASLSAPAGGGFSFKAAGGTINVKSALGTSGGGAISFLAPGGTVNVTGSVTASDAGSISVLANSVTVGELAVNNDVALTAPGGRISISADSIALPPQLQDFSAAFGQPPGTFLIPVLVTRVAAANGTVALASQNAGAPVSLGETGAGLLLNGNLLAPITATGGTLEVGRLDGGAVTVTSSIASPAGATTLRLLSGAGADISAINASTLTIGTLTGSAGGNLDLGSAAHSIGNLGAAGINGGLSAVGALTLTNATSLKIAGPVSAGSVNLSVAAGQSLDVASAGSITAGTNGTVSLAANAMSFAGAVVAPGAGGAVELMPATSGLAITLGSPVTGLGLSQASLSQVRTGTLRIGGGTKAGAVASDVSVASAIDLTDPLDSAKSLVDRLTFLVTGKVSDAAGGSLTVGTLGGLTTGLYNAGQLDLTNTANAIGAIEGFRTSGNFTLVNGRTLAINGPLSAGVNLKITNAAGISVDGTVKAGVDVTGAPSIIGGNLELKATSGDLTVATAGAASAARGTLFLNGGQVSLAATAGAVTVDGSVTSNQAPLAIIAKQALSVDGTLTANGSAITLSGGGITVGGTGALKAATGASLTATGAGGDILLKAGSEISTSGGAVTLSAPDTITINGGITGATTGPAATTLTLTGGAAVSGSGTIAVEAIAGSTASVDLTTGPLTVSRLLDLSAGDGGLSLTTPGDLSVAGKVASTGTVALKAGSLTIVAGGAIAAAGEQVSLIATAGSITGTDGIVAAGTLKASATATGGAVTLNNAANEIAAIGNVTADTTIALASSVGTTIAGTLSAPNGVEVVSGAAGAAALSLTGSVTAATGPVLLKASVGALTLKGPVTAGDTSTVSLLAAGGLTHASGDVQGGAVVMQAGAGTLDLAGSSVTSKATDVTLSGATVTLGSTVTSERDLFVTAGAGASSLGGTITAGRLLSVDAAGDLAVPGTLEAASASVVVKGALSQIAAGSITTTATDADLSLTGASLSIAGTLDSARDIVLATTAGDATLNGGITAAGLLSASTKAGAIKVTSASGVLQGAGVTLTADGALTQTAGSITATATDRDLGISGASLGLSGPLNSGRAITLKATAGDATLNGTIKAAGLLSVDATGGGIASGGALQGASMTLQATGLVNQTGGTATTTSGTLAISGGSVTIGGTLDSQGAITLAGTSGAVSVAGNATAVGLLSATAATTLTTSGTLEGAGVTLSATGAFEQLSGAGSKITSSGAANTLSIAGAGITVAGVLQSAGAIAFTGSGAYALGGTVTATGALSASGASALTLKGVLQGAEVTLKSTGAISQTGGTLKGTGIALEAGGLFDQAAGSIASTGAANDLLITSAGTKIAGTLTSDRDIFFKGGGLYELGGSVTATRSLLAPFASGMTLTGALKGGDVTFIATGTVEQTSGTVTSTSATGDLVLRGATTTLGAGLSAGRDLEITGVGVTVSGTASAGRDIRATATGALSASGTLTATRDLSLTAEAGTLTVSGSATATNGQATLRTGTAAPDPLLPAPFDIKIPGTVTAGTTLTLTSVGGVSAGGTGTLKAATLTGNVAVSAVLDGATAAPGGGTSFNNEVGTLASFAAGKNFVLANKGDLTVTGPVRAADTLQLDLTGTLRLLPAAGQTSPVPTVYSLKAPSLVLNPGSIEQDANAPIFTSVLTIQAGQEASLTSKYNVISFVTANSSDDIIIASASDLTLFGAVNATGTLSISANGSLTIPGGSTATSGKGMFLTARGGDIVLSGGVLNWGTTQADSALTLTAAGSLRQTAGTVTGGTGSLVTGSAGGAFLLAQPGNTFAKAGPITATAGLSLSSTTDLAVVGKLEAGSGALSLASGGALSLDAVPLTGSSVSLTATGGDIAQTVGGTLTTAGDLVASAGGDVLFAGQVGAASASLAAGGAISLAGALPPAPGQPPAGGGAAGSFAIAGPMTLAAGGDVALNGAITGSGLVVNSGGSIGQPGGASLVLGGALELTAAQAIALNGGVTATGATLKAGGDLQQLKGAFLSLGGSPLSIQAGGAIRLDGANAAASAAIAGGSLSQAAGASLALSGPLSLSTGGSAALNGSVTAGTIDVAAGLDLSQAASGTLASGGRLNLSAGRDMTLNGFVSGSPMTLVAGGDIAQATTGSLSTAALSVRAGGSARFLGAFSAGTVTGSAGQDFIITGAPVQIGTLSDVTAGRILDVETTTGGMVLQGGFSAPSIILYAAGPLTMSSINIATGGVTYVEKPPGIVFVPRLPEPIPGTPGAVLETGSGPLTAQAINVTPLGTPNATLALRLPTSGGTITIGQLKAPQADVTLDLGTGGRATANIEIRNLTVLGGGGGTELRGTVRGFAGQSAASVAGLGPRASSEYRINDCPLASVNCVQIVVTLPVSTNPLAALTTIVAQEDRDDADTFVPNVAEKDF
ncbi:filamentous hemagglutinin N-terminal domain-containing protein [Falsiroseomonas sp. HW251]|uniref:two-partner secretion domain-containing protein n=1 Tax=Falsiroseomonas sp. HW251 TaxID=3390998 RepID=UPI003D3134DD